MNTCRTTEKKLGQISASRNGVRGHLEKEDVSLDTSGSVIISRIARSTEILNGVNWPCTIVAALERTSKALSTADISSLLRWSPLLEFLPPAFLFFFSLPPPSSPRSFSLSLHPRAEIRAHPRSASASSSYTLHRTPFSRRGSRRPWLACGSRLRARSRSIETEIQL